jgi:hypothetical protein
MPSDTFTKTGRDVADMVKRQFGDPDGRQITDADILNWINAAQQDIVSQNPILKETLETSVIAGQDVYRYPAQMVQYIEAIHFKGVPLESYSFQEAQAYILQTLPEDGTMPEAPRPTIWYERDGDIYLFPTPSISETNVLRMFYVRQPEEIEVIADTLSVPDRYFQRVIDLVLARAYQLDENWEAAKYKQAEFITGMDMLANREGTSSTNTFPTITVRIEDL